MNSYVITLTLLTTMPVFGQNKDKPAEPEIQTRVKEISVSPDGKIWLLNGAGKTYYINGNDSNWYYRKSAFETTGKLSSNNYLERVSFFNKDTAIITGGIAVRDKDHDQVGFYITRDGGNLWEFRDLGSSWIHTAFVDTHGNAWMGDSSGTLYYSKDFAQHWETLNSPYTSTSHINSIFMLNSREGVSGSSDNKIYTTTDNWKSNKKIMTPLEQGKYTKGFFDDEIKELVLWNNYIVVKQGRHIFYSDGATIDWKSFPVEIVDFALDKDSKKLFAVSDSLKLICFSTPVEFKTVAREALRNFPIDMKVVNHSLFLVTHRTYENYEVHKVNEDGMIRSFPYITGKEISMPVSKQFKSLAWGIDGKQLYISESGSHNWYKESAFDLYFTDFKLVDDSTAILWDGIKNNYLYSLRDHRLNIYIPDHPLKSFLASPIQSFSIKSFYSGCMSQRTHEVCYERITDSTFKVTRASASPYLMPYRHSRSHKRKQKEFTFENTVNGDPLTAALASIDSNPARIPSLKDFHFTAQDKKNYLSLIKNKPPFYNTVPFMLDTLNDRIVKNLLDQRGYYDFFPYFTPSGSWFRVEIINQNKDTLGIERIYYRNMNSNPHNNLNWKYEYKGLTFTCYDVAFSKVIKTCIPDQFMDKVLFENKIVILQIADYLYSRTAEKN